MHDHSALFSSTLPDIQHYKQRTVQEAPLQDIMDDCHDNQQPLGVIANQHLCNSGERK